MHNFDCVTRRAIFRNNDQRPTRGSDPSLDLRGTSKVIQKASSLTIDFESPILPFHMVQLSGRFVKILL
jgi:hypothetical protein